MTPPSAVRAVIFDLGGVILRTEDRAPRTALAESLGLTYPELEDAVFRNPVAQQAERGLATPDEAWAAIALSLNLPEEQIPALNSQFFGGDRVDFALIAYIQSLRTRVTTALLSNTWIVDLPGWLRENLQVPDTFDVVISSAHRHIAKPDPAIFRLALDLVKARPEEAVFVDDYGRNVAAAASLGIRTVHFKSTDQARQEIEGLLNPVES